MLTTLLVYQAKRIRGLFGGPTEDMRDFLATPFYLVGYSMLWLSSYITDKPIILLILEDEEDEGDHDDHL